MKKNKSLKIIIIILSIIFMGLLIFTFVFDTNTFNVANISDNLPPNINELLKKDYGKSNYRLSKGGVSIDIERVLNEKYFITYSWMSGNQSSFYIVFLVENENKNPISNHKVNNLKVIDNMGMEYKPTAFFFDDYPVDEPLKYKETLNVKFLPFNDNVKSITVTFNYAGNDYKFKNIPI
ncbi:hypothetical protein [uncultured Anaerofustis sp.]|uniref:hypothetical protein n=1 Tax=uncultured Anaerofustis sp. TaxID=904996 RepID=UPI0025DFDA87|nr:hypothetical protein [uncultured Anaerofustis sp.]